VSVGSLRRGASPPPVGEGGIDAHCTGVVQLYKMPDGDDVVALRGVDLDIDAGEMVALLGPSGTGKSTVLRLLAGLLRPSAGRVHVGGYDLGKLPGRELTRLRATEIAYVLQDAWHNLLPYATAEQNIWFARRGARRYGSDPPGSPRQLLEQMGIGHLAGQVVSSMSGGEQQRVAVAAGVASGARLLLVDEPTSQLDSHERDAVVDQLRSVNRDRGTTVVVVTHDPTVAVAMARTVTIRDGRVGSEGRHGEEYAVVGRDGTLQLPPDVLEVLPPDSRVRIVLLPRGVELQNVDFQRVDAVARSDP
jgi:putative ABC transport system ATP-binding protein